MRNVRPAGLKADAELLRIQDLTQWLGMSRSWIYQACREGRFPAPVRLGRRATVWRRRDVEAWLSSLTNDE